MQSRLLSALACSAAALVLAAPAQAGTLAAPRLQRPADGVTAAALPAVTWGRVAHAASYEVQIAADSGFGSLLGGRSLTTGNTALATTVAVADGDYFWRVRALTEKGRAGRWSP